MISNISPENLLLQPALLSGHFLECILKPGKSVEHGLYSHLFILGLKNISQAVKATGFQVNCFIAWENLDSYLQRKNILIMFLNAYQNITETVHEKIILQK